MLILMLGTGADYYGHTEIGDELATYRVVHAHEVSTDPLSIFSRTTHTITV